MAATQCIYASRCGEDDLLKFKPSIRMGKKGDLSDFERGRVVGARRADLSISKTADILGCSDNLLSSGDFDTELQMLHSKMQTSDQHQK